MDILQFEPVILDVLRKLKVKKPQIEDLKQECYLALWEKQKYLENSDNKNGYAAIICRNKIFGIWGEKNYTTGVEKRKVLLCSLSDPKIYRKASKITDEEKPIPSASKEELEEAILTLPFDEYRIIYELYIQDKTQTEVAVELNLSEDQVYRRAKKGVTMLRKYFEGE